MKNQAETPLILVVDDSPQNLQFLGSLLTAKAAVDDIVKGFSVGAADHVTKPFAAAELLARIQTRLEVKQLRHLLPICANCRSIRDEEGYWHRIDLYITSHTSTLFSRGLCDSCAVELYGARRVCRGSVRYAG